jgi:hypothetical protein
MSVTRLPLGLILLSVGAARMFGSAYIVNSPGDDPDPYPSADLGLVATDPICFNLPTLRECINNLAITASGAISVGYNGGFEANSFPAVLTGDVFQNGVFVGPTIMTGSVDTIVQRSAPTDFGTFNTEMTQLNLTGNLPGIGSSIFEMVPPNSPSFITIPITSTTIQPADNGQFHIQSFFDVFTELSIDGGNNWTPASGNSSNSPAELDLTQSPEPGTAALTLLSAFALGLFFADRGKRAS